MSKFVLTAQLQLQAPTNVGQVVKKIQGQLKNVQVNVQAQGTQQANRQIQALSKSVNQAEQASRRLGKTFGASIKRFSALAIATRAVGLFTNTISKAVEESIAFERELIKISQVTGKSITNLRTLTKTISTLSTTLGTSSTSLLKVSRILSQAGLSAKQTEVALRTLAKTDLAPTFDDITQTTEGAVAIFNQFRQGAEALEAQLGAINAVAGKFAVEAGDLISVVRRTGGVFRAAGGDLNELIALFTSVRATTRESAESIATGLRTIFTRIQRPKTIEFLKQFGVELLDVEGKFVGPYEAVRRLSQALAGLEQGDITFVRIAEELGGFRQIGKVIPLLQQFSVAQEALNVAQKGSSSLAEDAAKAQASLAVRIVKVKEEFLALVRGITETPTFQIMANTALNLASALIKVADSLKPILPIITAIAAVKFTQGIGGFLGGITGGLTGGRGPKGFARGGLVPGSGNRDTVPAMLTPGEFVIKKSSVAKLGAGTLAQMNENRYNDGTTGTGIRRRKGQRSAEEIAALTAGIDTSNPRQRGIESRGNLGDFGLAAMYGTSDAGFVSTPLPNSEYSVNTKFGVLDKKISNTYETKMKSSVRKISTNFANTLAGDLKDSTPIQGAALNQLIDKAGFSNAVGAFFETALALTGAPYEQKSAINDSLDFASGLGNAAGKFGLSSGLPADATRTAGSRGKSRAKFAAQIKRYLARDKEYASLPGFASGGAVGTDTVPALLTPGEFVINKAASKYIGYNNLNRMNKVGRYARGGIVQRFANGGAPTPMGSPGSLPVMYNTQPAADKSNNAQKLLVASASLTSLIQQFGLGESAFGQLVTAVGSSVTQLSALGTGLEAITGKGFNFATLDKDIGDALKKTRIGARFQNLSNKVGIAAKGFASGYAAFTLLNSVISSFINTQKEYEEAIKEGKSAAAGDAAVRLQAEKDIDAFGAVASGAAGAIAGAFLGPQAGALVGAITGLTVGMLKLVPGVEMVTGAFRDALSFLTFGAVDSSAKIRELAEVAALSSASVKALGEAGDLAQKAQKDLDAGRITATEALNQAFGTASAAVAAEAKRIQRSRFSDPASREALQKNQQELISQSGPLVNKVFRSVALSGGTFEEAFAQLPQGLQDVLTQLGADDQIKAFENIAKEVEIARKKFEALNLGFRSIIAASDATANRVARVSASFEAGFLPAVAAADLLNAAMTSAGQNISQAEVDKAIQDVASTMRAFGADNEQIRKFQENTNALAAVQRGFPDIFEKMKDDIEAGGFKGMTSEAAGTAFKDLVDKQLQGMGIGDDVRERILDAMGGVELTPEDIAAIGRGDFSVLEKYLGDAGKEVSEVMGKLITNLQNINKELIQVTKARIDAERDLVKAQKEAINLMMEGREIQAKFGGAAVTPQERMAAILGRANAGAAGAGIGQLRTGSIAELRARNAQIRAGAAGFQAMASREGGLAGVGGVEAAAQQENLKQAYQDQIQTIRDLIKLEQDNLNLIKEKNKAERDAIDSLLAGDLDKFFEQQATAGATAAIALGSDQLMGAFGAGALGRAAQDIRRQQEAGQTTLFGQQLAGAGGLTERGFGAAIGAMGVTDPNLARIAAGTTAEELAAQQRLQGLGGALAEAGQVGVDMAEFNVQTATIRAERVQLAAGQAAAELGMATGGMVYANRGMFIPRGTDTVPAMLTPGEFVVRREAVQRGNNLALLKAMNNNNGSASVSGGVAGMAMGGVVRYRANGSTGAESGGGGFGLSPELINKLSDSLNSFNSQLSANIDKINQSNFNIKLDTTNVNVNITGTSFLGKLKDDIKDELLQTIGNKIKSYRVGDGGRLQETGEVL